MTLFDLAQLIVFILITLIVITGGLLTLMFLESLIECTIKAIKRRKTFNRAYPIGSLFATRDRQEFPHGEWECIGQDQNGFYLYERTK